MYGYIYIYSFSVLKQVIIYLCTVSMYFSIYRKRQQVSQTEIKINLY